MSVNRPTMDEKAMDVPLDVLPHAFVGRSDRWCEVCDRPDRNPIHDRGAVIVTDHSNLIARLLAHAKSIQDNERPRQSSLRLCREAAAALAEPGRATRNSGLTSVEPVVEPTEEAPTCDRPGAAHVKTSGGVTEHCVAMTERDYWVPCPATPSPTPPEPTAAQVEAAAKAHYEQEFHEYAEMRDWGDLDNFYRDKERDCARAALLAAAEVKP